MRRAQAAAAIQCPVNGDAEEAVCVVRLTYSIEHKLQGGAPLALTSIGDVLAVGQSKTVAAVRRMKRRRAARSAAAAPPKGSDACRPSYVQHASLQ